MWTIIISLNTSQLSCKYSIPKGPQWKYAGFSAFCAIIGYIQWWPKESGPPY